jgi:hypothetical protein
MQWSRAHTSDVNERVEVAFLSLIQATMFSLVSLPSLHQRSPEALGVFARMLHK